jgi:pimeloyl-ACP methyl ester carboxylesterase
MSAIILDGEIVHYEVLGRGRPLIFLHGWVGSWRYWIPTMQVTSMSFRSYAIDLWGFGDTANKSQNYLIESQVRLLEKFLHKLGIGKVGLVGHGLGAILALLYSLKNPEKVDRMMAVSLPFDSTTINSRLRSATPTELVEWLLSEDPLTEPVRAEAPKQDPQAIITSLNDLKDINPLQTSIQLAIPCLMVHGQNDPLVSTPEGKDLLAMAANVHRISFHESGHFPMLDQRNKFNRLLIDFLSLKSGEPPSNLTLKDEWQRRVR